MPEFNPNDMDALFRDGADRHEFEYNSDSWALMVEKLDKRDKKRRLLFYLLGIVVLIASIGAYAYLSYDQIDKRNFTSTPQLDSKIEKSEEIVILNNKIEIESSGKTLYSDEQIGDTKEYISTDSKESSNNIGAQNSFQSENTGNLIGNEIVSIASPIETIVDIEQIEQIQIVSSIENSKEVDNFIKVQEKNDSKNLSFASLIPRNFEVFDSGYPKFDVENLEPSKIVDEPVIPSLSNRFALSVFANPEWSSVGLLKESKAGWSVGAKVGYQFSNKFELNTGIAYSRKIYKGTGNEYTMEGGWYSDIEPMQMDAKCDVIEIPLALSYYVNGFRNSGFFADLGINSYMLHSEWYGFEYADALVRPARYNEVIEEDQNTHLVGVGRFAIGFQKVLSNNTSFQVAPYIQFPLTGIGAGRVNLYSSGVQIAVKFNTQ